MDPLIFRKASKSDAPTLSELGERTFRNTFASDNTPEDLEAYIARAFRTGQIASELADPAVTFLLVYAGDKPVGYAKLKTGHVPESVQGAKPLEIERLYVDQSLIGKGVGRALIDQCMAEALARGYRTVWLGVWERNTRAIKFYRKYGFVETGDKPYVIGSDVQRDLVMVRALEK